MCIKAFSPGRNLMALMVGFALTSCQNSDRQTSEPVPLLQAIQRVLYKSTLSDPGLVSSALGISLSASKKAVPDPTSCARGNITEDIDYIAMVPETNDWQYNLIDPAPPPGPDLRSKGPQTFLSYTHKIYLLCRQDLNNRRNEADELIIGNLPTLICLRHGDIISALPWLEDIPASEAGRVIRGSVRETRHYKVDVQFDFPFGRVCAQGVAARGTSN